MTDPQFRPLDIDLFFAGRLARVKVPLFGGGMNSEMRREAIRAAIIDGGVANNPIGRGETFRAAFERLYGCALERVSA